MHCAHVGNYQKQVIHVCTVLGVNSS